MSAALTAEVFADTRDEFIGPEHAFRFDDRPLAMPPARLNRVEPRTLDRQAAFQDAHAPLVLGLSVMAADPAADLLAAVPDSIIPHEHEHVCILCSQTGTQPVQRLDRHGIDRATSDKAQPDRLRVSS